MRTEILSRRGKKKVAGFGTVYVPFVRSERKSGK